MKKCFEFTDYKAFMKQVEEARSSVQRGFRSKLAVELGVQNAYVSKVLNGDAHFSLEQGIRLCDFLGLEGDERQFLIWLIPVVPLVRGRRGLWASVLLLAALVLTQIWFPFRYFRLALDFEPGLSWVLLARDLVLVALVLLLVPHKWRRSDVSATA